MKKQLTTASKNGKNYLTDLIRPYSMTHARVTVAVLHGMLLQLRGATTAASGRDFW